MIAAPSLPLKVPPVTWTVIMGLTADGDTPTAGERRWCSTTAPSVLPVTLGYSAGSLASSKAATAADASVGCTKATEHRDKG